MKPLHHVCCASSLGLGLVAALALTPRAAHAADASPPVAPAAAVAAAHANVPHVDVAVAGSFPSAQIVAARVAGWFTGQGIATQTEVGPEPSATWVLASTQTLGVRIWITLSSPTTARLFFSVQERAELPPRFLVQDVELRSGVDELGIERLAQVANFSAVAAWGGSAESSRQEVEQGLGVTAATTPVTVTAAPTAARVSKAPSGPTIFPAKPYWRFIGGFSYETRWRGDEGTFIGTGANAGVSRRYEQNELSARLIMHIDFVPYSITKDGTTFQPNRIGWGLVLGARHYLPFGIWLGAELEAAREFVSLRLPPNGIWRDLPSDSLPWSWWLGGGLGIGYEHNGWNVIGLFATASVALSDQDYVVQDAMTGGHHKLLSPWQVQPGLSLRVFF